MKIQISGQYGEPKADDIFWPIQKKLNDAFKSNVTNGYFNDLSTLAIAFRVSGKAHDFGSKGPERMRCIKKDKRITIDLVFPVEDWLNTSNERLIIAVKCGVLQCLNLMIEKSKKSQQLIDEKRLLTDIDKALHDFEKGFSTVTTGTVQ
jgi:hypothetical protein